MTDKATIYYRGEKLEYHPSAGKWAGENVSGRVMTNEIVCTTKLVVIWGNGNIVRAILPPPNGVDVYIDEISVQVYKKGTRERVSGLDLETTSLYKRFADTAPPIYQMQEQEPEEEPEIEPETEPEQLEESSFDKILKDAQQNFNIISTVDDEEIAEGVWNTLVEKEPGLRQLFTDEDLASYDDFTGALARYNIDFPQRFSNLSAIAGVLNNRMNEVSDTAKKCIIIFPKADYNGTFDFNQIDRLTKMGYKVSYFEAGDENEAKRFLEFATDSGASRADLIILGGHGTDKVLGLGADTDDPSEVLSSEWDEIEEAYIDTGDFIPIDEMNFGRYIKPNGDLVLDSYSNGADGKKNPYNLANVISGTLPKGVRIHSAPVNAAIIDISVNGEGKIKVSLDNKDPYVTKGLK